MKSDEREYMVYSGNRKKRSRYELAREVKRGICRIEQTSGLTLTQLQRRRVIRHEVLHHLPVENYTSWVDATVVIQEDKALGRVHICHPDAPGCLSILSILSPLRDRRFKQTFNEGDQKALWLTLRILFTRKK